MNPLTQLPRDNIRIDIGGGNHPKTGYLSCDIRQLSGIDFVCNADELPFHDEQVTEIYSRHLIEHLSFKKFLKVLEEWNRVLQFDGTLYIICPNLLWHLNQILKGSHQSFFTKDRGKNDRYWGFGSLFGWQQDEHDVHQFGYYFELLSDVLQVFGFDEIEDLTNTKKGMENEPWHLEVRAKKKCISPNHQDTIFYRHFDVKH